ncbi:MAG: PmeII family type II restriction endonuclease [Bellilinea sp.]
MKPLNLNDAVVFVERNIGDFHQRRAASLANLSLTKILKRKNPYLFKAKNILTASEFVKNLLDAHLSSQEEAIFGEFLEQLAIFVNEQVYGGKKSTAEGIDLEFNRDGVDYIVSIKSGPNWGNSGQISKMKENFRRAIRIKKTGNRGVNIQAINGCCYGIDNHPEKDGYTKLCGQRFWEFISGNQDLYIQIIEPLGYKAKEKNEEFLVEYGRIINVFEAEFLHDYCPDGRINWEKLVRLNSGTV